MQLLPVLHLYIYSFFSRQVIMMADELNEKQKRFAKEYVKDFNGKQAAIRAGYSEVSSSSTASELLTYPKVQAAIQKEIQKRNKRIEVTQDRVVEELAKIGFSDIKDVVEWDGDSTRIKDSSEVDGTIIAEITDIETFIKSIPGGKGKEPKQMLNRTKKVKLHDKMKALELLARHMGMLKDVKQVHLEGDLSNLSDDEINKMMARFGLKPEESVAENFGNIEEADSK